MQAGYVVFFVLLANCYRLTANGTFVTFGYTM